MSPLTPTHQRTLLIPCILSTFLAAAPALADGFIIVKPHPIIVPPRPRPPRITYMPLSVTFHRVTVGIDNAAAVTTIDQSFHNPNPRQLEGTYIFPLPDDVAVQRFSMFMNGKEVQGELLAKDKAREIYENYVRKMKDPALLEYVGTRMFKARVFPIPAQGDVRIKLEYTQAVPVTNGLATYRYPLNTEKFSSKPLEEVTVTATVRSDVPLASVFSPSHPVAIDTKGPKHVVASYEDKDVRPDKDFLLYYNLSEGQFGLSLVPHRSGGEDGFFMARLAPKMPEPGKVLPKDICFVIDTSGSMAGLKMEQAKKSLRFCLSNLNAKDRFNVVGFSTESRPFRDGPAEATAENVRAAREHVSDLKAIGGTNINEALLDALKMSPGTGKRPYMVVFMTDGEPTVGVTDVKTILANVGKANEGQVRIFVLGVGTQVNTRLLDRLSDENHGNRTYITEKEDLEIKLSNFYTALANPVFSDVKLTFEGVTVRDVYPKKLPDLFKGTELVVYGRYSGSGSGTVKLSGNREETKVLLGFEADFPGSTTAHDFVPRLWASVKIGYLLEQMRLHGETKELKDEIVRLSKTYGIMTELTSWLVLEDKSIHTAAAPSGLRDALAAPEQKRLARRGRVAFQSASGADAVEASRQLQRLQGVRDLGNVPGSSGGKAAAGPGARAAGRRQPSQVGASAPMSELRDSKGRRVIQAVGAKTFYRDGTQWVDSVQQLAGEKAQEPIKIALYSDEYFKLVRTYPEAGQYLAIGPEVVVVLGGQAYQTVETN